MRQLSSKFVKTLTGELKNLLDCIVQDKELDMQIRDGYVNVYYHGGNILRIKPRSFEFDEMYYNDPSVMRSTYARKDVIIHKQLSVKRDELKKLLPNNPQEYFRQAKAAMDEWAEKLRDIAEYEEKLYRRLDEDPDGAAAMRTIRETGALDETAEASLKAALTAFTQEFIKNR